MILRRIARPQAIVKQFEQLSQSTLPIHQQRRLLHQVPTLGGPNNERGIYFAEHGIPGFLSPQSYRQTWEKYQGYLIEQINTHTQKTQYADQSVYKIHIDMSRRPEFADFYNFAAMAHFNHLWWSSLTPTKKPVPDSLRKDIEEEFNSMDTLRTEMLEHADAMFGNGFVWLMKEPSIGHLTHGKLRILCTYNAGSPYSQAWHMRMDRESSTGLNIGEERSRRLQDQQQMTRVQNYVGSFGAASRHGNTPPPPPNALGATPLLCLNVWQHMWVPDFGILGKRAYLGAWWDAIDWDVVQTRYNQADRMTENY